MVSTTNYTLIKKDGTLFITLDEAAPIEVYDLLGNLVYSSSSQLYHEVRIGQGMYIVRSKKFVQKIVL